jgi:hypothetical protein
MDPMFWTFVASQAALLLITARGFHELRGFLAETTAISDSRALEHFKTVARHNMYGALAQIPLGVITLVAGGVLVLRHGLVGLLGVLAANAVLFALARQMKALELRARSLPSSSPEIQRQHQHIGEVWGKRPLPDF